MSGKPILCLDFDGVLHSYASGWITASFIPDPPVPGAFDFLYEALQEFNVKIFSSRSQDPEGVIAMRTWIEYWAPRELDNHDPDWRANAVINRIATNQDAFPATKPAAFLTIDDRALRFTGNWDEFHPATLRDFQPWNKREPAPFVALPVSKPRPKFMFVPTEPTLEMLNAYDEARAATTLHINGVETYNPHQAYWAMLRAAPNFNQQEADYDDENEAKKHFSDAQLKKRIHEIKAREATGGTDPVQSRAADPSKD